MIRPITPDDIPGLIVIAKEIGFEPNELEQLNTMFNDYFVDNTDNNDFCVTDEEDGLVGVAYCAPEPMTNRTWNLLLIAIRPNYQGQGRGKALLHYVEQTLSAAGERLLLVETSGLENFQSAREFYRKCGYEEEGRIRDFYDTSDDKIVFRKLLSTPSE
ncbi:MAG: GNAT family N-acetyltransferase [Cyanobacteriota bacterium]|nr:GNAT family N-acetyltransferase [Cyanobacteriota bacterium]